MSPQERRELFHLVQIFTPELADRLSLGQLQDGQVLTLVADALASQQRALYRLNTTIMELSLKLDKAQPGWEE